MKGKLEELFSKIKWDRREIPEGYSIVYKDLKSTKEVDWEDIEGFDGGWMIINDNGVIKEVPIHRVRQIKNEGKVVYQSVR